MKLIMFVPVCVCLYIYAYLCVNTHIRNVDIVYTLDKELKKVTSGRSPCLSRRFAAPLFYPQRVLAMPFSPTTAGNLV